MTVSERGRRHMPDRSGAEIRRVFVQRLELMASVGVFEVEKRYEQRILVSAELDVTDVYDGQSDRLEDVFDYGLIVDAAHSIVASRHFNLIETMAHVLAEACLAHPVVQWVRITIEKPDIIARCPAVGISIERSRRN